MLQSMQKERRAVRGRRKGVHLASSVVYIILYGHDEIICSREMRKGERRKKKREEGIPLFLLSQVCCVPAQV